MTSTISIMALSRSLLLAPFVAAQSIYPSNDQLAIPAVQMQMVYSVNDAMTTTKTANVAPLTPEIGLGQPANMLNVSGESLTLCR